MEAKKERSGRSAGAFRFHLDCSGNNRGRLLFKSDRQRLQSHPAGRLPHLSLWWKRAACAPWLQPFRCFLRGRRSFMLKGKTVITLDGAVLRLLELHLRSRNTENAPQNIKYGIYKSIQKLEYGPSPCATKEAKKGPAHQHILQQKRYW